jgi:hypothetical protein
MSKNSQVDLTKQTSVDSVVKTSKRLPKKSQVDLKTTTSVHDLLPQSKKKFKVLTPETIAIMKTNFDLAFHRTYDKEDAGDNR